MDISFIVLTWNSADYLEKCLNSVVDALADTRYSYEIHILDNGSRDGTAALLQHLAQAHPDHIFPCYETVNLGTTQSRNRLLARARGDYLCVVDSDVELARGVVDALLPLIAKDRGIGIVAPRIVYLSSAWQKSFDRAKFSHIKGLMYYFLKHRYFFKRPILLANQPKPSNN